MKQPQRWQTTPCRESNQGPTEHHRHSIGSDIRWHEVHDKCHARYSVTIHGTQEPICRESRGQTRAGHWVPHMRAWELFQIGKAIGVDTRLYTDAQNLLTFSDEKYKYSRQRNEEVTTFVYPGHHRSAVLRRIHHRSAVFRRRQLCVISVLAAVDCRLYCNDVEDGLSYP
jgi:hypothetical protein